MTTTIPSAALVPIAPVFTNTERLAPPIWAGGARRCTAADLSPKDCYVRASRDRKAGSRVSVKLTVVYVRATYRRFLIIE